MKLNFSYFMNTVGRAIKLRVLFSEFWQNVIGVTKLNLGLYMIIQLETSSTFNNLQTKVPKITTFWINFSKVDKLNGFRSGQSVKNNFTL